MSGVDLYTKDIVQCADRLVEGKEFGRAPLMLLGMATTGATAWFSLQFLLNPLYHLSGFVTMLVDRVADNYVTHKVLKTMEDKRFFEYGIDKVYIEDNWVFKKIFGPHPTTKQQMGKENLLLTIYSLVIGTALPPFAYGFLSNAYPNYLSASNIGKRIEKALELGDQVKEKVQAGAAEEEIRNWLKDLNNCSSQ